MAELGETTDPRLLVPGAAEAARAIARSLVAYAGNLSQAGDGLARITTPEGWSGEAADAFRSRFTTQPPAWQDAGDAFTNASRALDVYGETLEWAQRQAAEAVRLFAEAQATSQQAAATDPVDPGEAGRAQARGVLDHGRGRLAVAGDDAAWALDEAAAVAPTSPSFWSEVGDVAADVGRDVVNAVASLGNAAVNHPADVAAMFGGVGLMALGAGGALGGGALAATGAGAPVGVPVSVASAGLIATGAGVAGAGAISMAVNAAGDDRVEPLGSADAATASPTRPAAQRPTVENRDLQNIIRDLYRGVDNPRRVGDGTTADALRAERASGGQVGNREHFRKASQYVRALKHWLRRNPDASPVDRGIAQNELDNLLDALGRST